MFIQMRPAKPFGDGTHDPHGEDPLSDILPGLPDVLKGKLPADVAAVIIHAMADRASIGRYVHVHSHCGALPTQLGVTVNTLGMRIRSAPVPPGVHVTVLVHSRGGWTRIFIRDLTRVNPEAEEYWVNGGYNLSRTDGAAYAARFEPPR